MRRKSLIAAFAAGVLVVAVASPGAADQLHTGFSNGVVTGDATVLNDFGDALDLACSQTGTAVSMKLGASSRSSHANLALKIAFTNPSVSWESVTESATAASGYAPGHWAYSGTDKKVYSTDSVTIVTLDPNWSGTYASKNTQQVTGNPFVYYQDNNGNWNALGHCNQGKGAATIPLRNWSLTTHVGHRGNHVKGSCFTSSTKSNLDMQENAWGETLTQTSAKYIVYSNKQLETDTASGALIAKSGNGPPLIVETSTAYPIADTNWNGFHIWGNGISGSISVPGLNLSKLYPKSAVQGIGGNPNVWIGLGPNDSPGGDQFASLNNFYLLGRCKSI